MLKPIFEFDYWGLPVYAIMAALGLLFAALSLSGKQAGINCTALVKRRVDISVWTGFAAGLACANVANWFLFPGMLKLALLQRIEQGGFSFYYGMLGFFCVSALLLRACRLDWKFWADQLVPSVLILHAFGRIGCSLSGCCYGAPVELFGVSFDFPARELEAACLFCLYFLFEKKIRGHRFFWYLLCYSTLRFLLEFGRGDDRGVFLIEWLSPAQVTSVLIWAGLAVFMVFHRLLGNRTFPANYQSRN